MSNPIPIEFNSDQDEFHQCFPSKSESTATPGLLDNTNTSKVFCSQVFEDQLNQDDDEFNSLNKQLQNVLLTDNYRPSLIQAFSADMYKIKINKLRSSYLSHEKLTRNSRKMQSEYEQANIKEREFIFNTYIRNNIIHLSLDKYMHYILEKIIEFGPTNCRNIILDQIFHSIKKLVVDLHACKVMQKGLEVMSLYSQESQPHFQKYINFILEENNFTRRLYTDKIGNQIFTKSLDVLDEKDLESLVKIFDKYILNPNQYSLELSTDQYGCLIVNKIIDIFPKLIDPNTKSITNDIIIRTIKNSSCLIRRQYANYIIQQILEKGQENHKRLLLNNYLIKDFVAMSLDKYGSNVAEKAIVYAGTQWRQKLWEEEVSVSESSFRKLVNDQFANYPIQRLYEYLSQDYRNEFIALLNRLHDSHFLNHHGQIVLKFSLANYNVKRFAQKVNAAENNKPSKLQEKNKQLQQIYEQQQRMNQTSIQYQQYLQQQQMMTQQYQLFQQQQQQQQQQFQSPVQFQQYQAMLLQQAMMMYQQPQQIISPQLQQSSLNQQQQFPFLQSIQPQDQWNQQALNYYQQLQYFQKMNQNQQE
ncbi:unnamed protein product (macronuclear) [Paramecium tetraurelia]|uniref:PUM-HD domain-containing protein n=1 Tax=Paramecium tetraurelia TaxID=5888 RepID=A0BMV2_PARTE|nr:uncharacterized protein GSPATT00030506001 [Paramecium tetraurelia]CAK59869.1 unnamed protein product [Paramecium tetraurelia]|eukprot:XP_001427267.1 hypothetical protein (macronuclear) [Paramecium tetraurelia strain d4-2]